MAFMESEITNKQEWIEVDGPCGIDFIPADLISGAVVALISKIKSWKDATKDQQTEIWSAISDYTNNREAWAVEITKGYGVRLSAAGYMDCTEWSVYRNKREALAAARELDSEEG